LRPCVPTRFSIKLPEILRLTRSIQELLNELEKIEEIKEYIDKTHLTKYLDVGEYTYGGNVMENNNFEYIYNKEYWKNRSKSIRNTKILEEIIDFGIKILSNKIMGGIIDFENEASMQMQLGIILNNIGKLYESNQDDNFHIDLETNLIITDIFDKSSTNKAKIDVTMCFGNIKTFATAAIELKYFKKQNHREPNNRYDVFTDISNLEKYKKQYFDICCFLLFTDHSHYVDQEIYSDDTTDFDFRNGKEYKAGHKLIYRTEKPYGDPIVLEGNYKFQWNEFNIRNKNKKLYSLVLKC
jgi:hypothetical protein